MAVSALVGKRFKNWPAPPSSIASLLTETPDSDFALRWGASDPQAALDWAATLNAGDEVRSVSERAVNAWGKVDPPSLSQFVLDLAPGAVRDGAIGGLAYALRGSDPDAAAAWVEQIVDDSYREHVSGNLSSTEGDR